MDRQAPPVRWTARQREVGALLARGMTNAAIAEQLGLSLDGAKWHVREIMSVLQVDSRDLAAEYWRRETGMRVRLWRWVGALAAGGRLAKAAGLGALGTVVAAVAIGAVLVARSGGEQQPAAATVTATASIGTTATPTPEPGAPATPGGGVLGTIDGLPVYELKLSAQAWEIPPDFVIYVTDVCSACSGGDTYRVRRFGGKVTVELIPKDTPAGIPPGGPVSLPVMDVDSGRMALLWCVSELGFCGKRHDGSVDAVPRVVLVSNDGGITWKEIGRLTGATEIMGFQDGQVVVRRIAGNQLSLIPSGAPYSGPILEPRWALPAGNAVTTFNIGPEDPGAFANEHSLAFGLHRPGSRPTEYVTLPGAYVGRLVLIDDMRLLTQAARGSKIVLAGGTTVDPLELGSVLIDLVRRTVHPVAGLALPSGGAAIFGVRAGPFLEVAGAGDCLNVREAAARSAAVVACYVDRVLLKDLGEVREADGIRWRRLQTPLGVEGWASMEFLK